MEEWKQIYDFPYEVSNMGNIRSYKGNDISLEPNKNGYVRVPLRNGKVKRNFTVHRLVAEFFLPSPTKEQLEWASQTKAKLVLVNHKDGIKTNNNVENLEWCTNSENVLHGYKHGLISAKGEKNSQCKLLDIDVSYIRNNYIAKHLQFGAKPLSEKYGVNISRIYSIARGDFR